MYYLTSIPGFNKDGTSSLWLFENNTFLKSLQGERCKPNIVTDFIIQVYSIDKDEDLDELQYRAMMRKLSNQE